MTETEKGFGIGRRNRPLLMLLVSITLFIGIVTALLPQKPIPYPDYITDSASPTGTKGFYTVLTQHFNQVDLWKKPVEDIRSFTPNQLMIMISPNSPFMSGEDEKWIDWMKKGNDVLLLTDDPEGFFQIKTDWYEIEDKEQPQPIYYQAQKMRTYQGVISNDFRIHPKADDNIILRDTYGALAISRTYGDGILTVLLAPDWLTNDGILKNNHLEMVIPLINQSNAEVIWLNEYIHGLKNRPPFFEVYPDWFILLLAQGALVLLLWLWHKGRRFGPTFLPREWEMRFGDERIHANAAWYLRGAFYKEALLTQRDYLYHLTKEKWSIPSNLEEKDWMLMLLKNIPKDRRHVWLQYWDGFTQLMENKKVSYKDFDIWSKRLDVLRKEVENR